jgi:hypothetical protein
MITAIPGTIRTMKEAFINYKPQAKTRVLIRQADEILNEYAAQGFVLTVRQLYYQFVARDLIENKQASYDKLGGIVGNARESGRLDWAYIEDRGRNLEQVTTWGSPAEIVQACVKQYKRDKWDSQPRRVEIWVEKDALLGVIERAVQGIDVPYMSCRGYPSISMLYEASRRLGDALILHLGDHDPSGIDATRAITEKLALYGSASEVRRIALTWEQVQKYSPPPNFAKEEDTRFNSYRHKYGTECWELDALEPQVIVDVIQDEVNTLIDHVEWDSTLEQETDEQKALREVAIQLGGWEQ